MSLQMLFPYLRGFRLLDLHREADQFILRCERRAATATCPLCGVAAHRVHSRYRRTVFDVSVQNVQVVLHLQVRKFYCDQPACSRCIFAERFPQVTTPHGRFTLTLRQTLAHLGHEQGGASAARAAHHLGIRVTPRAVLRFLHAQPLPSFAPPRVIGLDDWAWKRRERYGAIIVDLERRRPIALLADRSQATVIPWLAQHPTVDVVARDRSKEFAAAITAALPHAQQVADRWHLARNLTELLDKVIASRWKPVMHALRTQDAPAPAVEEIPAPRHAVGDERYHQVLALAQAGEMQKDIARRLGIGQRTVRRWLAQEHGPYAGPRKPHNRSRNQEWALTYLRERWNAGEHNGTVLWEELRARGYHGSVRSV